MIMSESEAKLTKKQKKALEFRNRTKLDPNEVKEEEKKKETELTTEEPVPKKRKTRRGKKGKGLAAQLGGGPRFILFVGNLPYDISQQELMLHFKKANPDRIRIRADKGIAFLEFYNIHQDIQKKIDSAVMKHHSILKDRKINVELTVGGGGNSLNRLAKLKLKNEKLEVERKSRIEEDIKLSRLKRSDAPSESALPSESTSREAGPSIHPSRAGMIK